MLKKEINALGGRAAAAAAVCNSISSKAIVRSRGGGGGQQKVPLYIFSKTLWIYRWQQQEQQPNGFRWFQIIILMVEWQELQPPWSWLQNTGQHTLHVCVCVQRW